MDDINGKMILFLDIDGVLNHKLSETGKFVYDVEDVPLSSSNLEHLKSFVSMFPDLRIVWTTDWRYYDLPIYNELKNPRTWLEQQKWFSSRLVGKTPRLGEDTHPEDIAAWLKENDAKIHNYAILEDGYFPERLKGIEKHLVRIDPEKGFCLEYSITAAGILGTDYRHTTENK